MTVILKTPELIEKLLLEQLSCWFRVDYVCEQLELENSSL